MADDGNFKDQFRAAKAARTSARPTKDQLKLLKAQKAQAAAAEALAGPKPDEDTKSMPPPPPRLTPAPASAPARPPSAGAGVGNYHEDSQVTRINEGGITTASLIQSEPSVNKASGGVQGQGQPEVGGALPAAGGNAASLAGSNALPSGFFDATAAQGQGSTTGMSHGAVGGALRSAKSAEGSTGGVEGLEPRSGSANPADLATSQLSAMPGVPWDGAAASMAVMEPQIEDSMREAASAFGKGPGSAGAGGASSLPKGFFDNAVAGVAAAAAASGHQHEPSKASAADLDKEYADFMKEVDEGATAAVAEAVMVEHDEDAARRAREDFEQFVRKERLRELREAAAKKEAPPGSGVGSAKTAGNEDDDEFVTAIDADEKPASALELAGISAEVAVPKIVLPKKRKVSETLAMLEQGGDGTTSSDEDEGDGGGEIVLDWRAKKSLR